MKKLFGEKVVNKQINADEVVAIGAAIKAAIEIKNEDSKKREEKNDEKSSSSFIGVDLGTTTSCVGIMNDNNKIEILQNRGNGSRLIPSVVCFTNETIYVGDSAINIGGYSKSKIYESKRLIGHKWDDKIIEEDIKRSNVKIIKDESGYVQYSFKINNEENPKNKEMENLVASITENTAIAYKAKLASDIKKFNMVNQLKYDEIKALFDEKDFNKFVDKYEVISSKISNCENCEKI